MNGLRLSRRQFLQTTAGAAGASLAGGALDSHEELPGPIYLQGSEKGHVRFRNIVVTPALE